MIKVRFTIKRSTPRHKVLIVWNIIISTIISLGVTIPTAAISRSTLEFYAQNGIFFYNPNNTVGVDSCVSGSNTTSTGSQVFTQAQLEFIEQYKPIFQAAADKYNFPWQILVALLARESGLNLNSPNSDGMYQIVSKTYPTGTMTEEQFASQTEDAAEFVANIISNNNLNISNSTDIKKLFLIYNSGAGGLNNSHFKELAVKYGFSADEPWEGSSYVMNYYDAARSPIKGGYPADHTWSDTYESAQKGTYTMYVALGGTGNDGCFFYTAGGYTLVYGASGMDANEAVNLMKVYRDRVHGKDSSTLISNYGLTSNNCSGGIAYNCVSFSRYFVNVYTSRSSNHITEPLGDGINVASSLISNYSSDFNNCGPTTYAIFSGSGSGSEGHTGVILGINTANDEIVTGEAACGGGENGIKVVVYSLVKFMSRYNKFACPVSGVNLSVDDGYQVEYPDVWNQELQVVTSK